MWQKYQICCCCWSLLSSTFCLLLSRLTALLSHVTLNEWLQLWISTLVVLLQHSLVLTWLVPLKTAAASVHSVYTIQRCTMSRYLMQSHIPRVHVCLAVTSNLHFWQNDQDFLHATAVMQGRSSYWNKSQHRKSTMEKKILLPQLKPMTFRYESGALTTELSLPPRVLSEPFSFSALHWQRVNQHGCTLRSCNSKSFV